MSWTTFAIVLAITALCTVGARVLPVLLFGGKSLPPALKQALAYIPPAAFAALVASDLFKPENWQAGWVANLIPLAALIPVALVGRKTKSLWLCIIVGVACYAALKYLCLWLGIF
ncbi:MAG: AzlD domain-containing protein [Coriobacteriales bacterium]|jgi:branched-subunit amino acid transport protein|nr:AzlD domain-containing protein [Coriobacteriales bacterium]